MDNNLHHHQWPQVSENNNKSSNKAAMDSNNKKLLARPSAKDEAANCPRCNSTNTKFCYYNNYSLSQPRYFCKGCRRYWTQGGSLRNVPVGGGSRKNRRPLSSPSSIKKAADHVVVQQPLISNHFNFLHSSDSQNPSRLLHEGHQDLNLEFPSSSPNGHYRYDDVIAKGMTLIGSSGNPSNFPYSNGGFANILEFKPPSSNSLSFSLDNNIGFGSSGFGNFQLGLQEGGGGGGGGGGGSGGGGGGARVLFPEEDLKPVGAAVEQINNGRVMQNGDNGGYWSSAMLGGGSW